MLVKVRNDDPSRLSSTERTVVNWLKSWSGPHAVPGIAVVQCQDADVVVWTPQTCVVVGVHGFTERVTGTLSCAQDEPWTVDGEPAPIDGDGDPLDGVHRQTMDLAGQLRSAPGRETVPVSGLVLLVPQLGSRVKLEKGDLPTGIDVLIGDGPSSLRAYFTSLAEGAPASWDAAQVGQALGALGFAAAATYSDLVSEGFPVPDSARDAPLPFANRPTEVMVPSVPPAGSNPEENRPPLSKREPGATGHGSAESRSGSSSTPRPGDRPVAQQEPAAGRGPGVGAAIAGATSATAAERAYRALAGTSEPQPVPGRTPPPPTPIPGAAQAGRPAAPPQARPPAPQPRPGLGPGPRTRPEPAQSASPQWSVPTAQQERDRFPVWNEPQPSGDGRKRRRDLPILGGLLLAVVILLIAVACVGGGSTPTKSPDKQPQPTHSSVVDTPPSGRSVDPTLPHTTVPPACFPLQPCR
ncbi:hypothetical protein ACFV4K_21565 [Nocardia sp. NPDC059764]|uniref:hypothetical protein n=1 Tax=Nocardia sp. NPDC059764 TaxID=3346939 RepID=UPI003652D513